MHHKNSHNYESTRDRELKFCVSKHLEKMCIRAGEFTKKNLYHGKNRVFGPKNAPKKFGSPTTNFPPPQFGLLLLH